MRPSSPIATPRRLCKTLLRAAVVCVLSFCLSLSVFIALVRQGSVYDVETYFDDPLTDDDVRTMHTALQVLTRILDASNVSYFMAAGTLLGSYRHHGRIPWDDDVDLTIKSSDKRIVYDALTTLAPNYGLFLSGTMESPYHWKFYPRTGSRVVPFRPYRFPYIDLLFYTENATHVWNASPNLRHECWPRQAVFPLRPRPFGQLWLPAPCDTATVLAINFDLDMCRSRHHSHVYDLPLLVGEVTVPCSSLYERYPFVRRQHVHRRETNQQLATESLFWPGNSTPSSQLTVHAGCK